MEHRSRRVRAARAGDAGAIAHVYNQAMEERIATFEVAPRTADEIRQALAERAGNHPTLVLELEGQVVGAVWCSQYRPRECYAGIAEFSVYVERKHRRHGFGRELIEALITESANRGLWKLVSRLFPENEASRRLLAACGFREVGVYHRHGKLDNRWRDCVVVEG